MPTDSLALGIDFGTSGARAAVIDLEQAVLTQVRCAYPSSDSLAESWRQTLFTLLDQIPVNLREQIGAIAVDGTSSSVLLCDSVGEPITSPLLYNDDQGKAILGQLTQLAPTGHTVCSATSSLAKLLWWQETLPPAVWTTARYFMHQADWLGFLLHGQPGVSDYHNALKLGYDVGQLRYPDWLTGLNIRGLLPVVKEPGDAIAPLQPTITRRFHFPPSCVVCAGTTDSIAAFLASGANHPGDAVTSLGSTLVLKLLSQTRIDNSLYGIYSHRLGDLWLVGGASNTGGAVLRHFFSEVQLADLSSQIDLNQTSSLDYYPLLKPGERFPLNDPDLPPRLTPRPENPVNFLYGLLDGIACIEQKGYALLETLGSTPLRQVYTAGGGAQNHVWTTIRQRRLNCPLVPALHAEAAVGAAKLTLNQLK
ncbi:MAG TPA: FGGY-family carbohydrate kinase [Leptolyngbyaceae cyanobacterium]